MAGVAQVKTPTPGQQAKQYDEKTLLERVSGFDKRQLFERTYADLKRIRANHEAKWQELADFVDPEALHRSISDIDRGSRRDQNIVDSSPRMALRTLQSGMHAGITSPARPWFKLTTADPRMAEQGDVKEWLWEVENRMNAVLLRSNIYSVFPRMYRDLGLFGVAAAMLQDDYQDGMRAYHYPVGSYAFALDNRGKACTFVREFTMTVRELLLEFGGEYGQELGRGGVHWENFSDTVKNLFFGGNLDARVTVISFVCPNTDYNPVKLYAKDSLAWRSCWFEAGRSGTDFHNRSGFLRESGYRVFPFLCPRWSATGGNTYSSDSPGMTAIGDIKQLQFMAKKIAKAIDKGIDPPLTASMALRNQKVSELPGDITYVDAPDVRAALSSIHEVNPQWLNFLNLSRKEVTYLVDQAFFVDLFRLLSAPDNADRQKTAEEVRALKEEQLIALGPTLESVHDEMLEPTIDRLFDVMLEFGAIPEPPDVLQGLALKVEFTSIMSQAMKLVGVAGHERFAHGIASLAEFFPGMTKKVDEQQWVDAYGDMLGINPNVIRTDEEAQELIQAEQQAMQQAQQAEQAQVQAQAANLLGKTPTKGGQSTALDDVTAGIQQQLNQQQPDAA